MNNYSKFRQNDFLIPFFAGIIVFILAAILVSTGASQNFDNNVLLFLRRADNTSIPIGPSWLKDFMTDVSSLGSISVIVLITAAVCGYFIVMKETKLIQIVLMTVIGGGALDLIFKSIFARQRPEIVSHLVSADSWSFPSGHSVMAAVVYLSLAAIFIPVKMKRELKVYILSAAVILTFLIGLSRIFLGVHYPTDVIGGWALGISWGAVCWALSFQLLKSNSDAEKING